MLKQQIDEELIYLHPRYLYTYWQSSIFQGMNCLLAIGWINLYQTLIKTLMETLKYTQSPRKVPVVFVFCKLWFERDYVAEQAICCGKEAIGWVTNWRSHHCCWSGCLLVVAYKVNINLNLALVHVVESNPNRHDYLIKSMQICRPFLGRVSLTSYRFYDTPWKEPSSGVAKDPLSTVNTILGIWWFGSTPPWVVRLAQSFGSQMPSSNLPKTSTPVAIDQGRLELPLIWVVPFQKGWFWPRTAPLEYFLHSKIKLPVPLLAIRNPTDNSCHYFI
jgi:hypothetical protein